MTSSFSVLIATSSMDDVNLLTSHIHSAFKCAVHKAATCRELDKCLQGGGPDILMVDVSSNSGEFGIDLVSSLRNSHPQLFILPLIPVDQRELVQRALALDISCYLHTPVEQAEVSLALTRAAEDLASRQNTPPTQGTRKSDFHGMIGTSPPMRKLFDLITRIADDEDSTVLIRGESGTGKEMVAKAIHAQSGRRYKNFVPVNCAAIPDDLLESELFGYTKGAFTGAAGNKIGRIQYANEGTLFLDEIGDMKASLQAKLLRVLQEKEFEPVGALKSTPVDTRILAATHCDLEQLVSEGRFREDLYYRISVIPLNIPPLKNRREDILLLADTFIHTYTIKRNREPFTFTDKALSALMKFDWRGNVRELENLIQHMSVLFSGSEVGFDDLPDKFQDLLDDVDQDHDHIEIKEHISVQLNGYGQNNHNSQNNHTVDENSWQEGTVDFKELISNYESELIIQAMKLADGNKKEAARLLNLKRTTLLEKIKKKSLNDQWNNE